MQQQERVAKLIDWFVRAALRHAEALLALQEEAAAILVQRLDRYYESILKEDGLRQFLALLDDRDPTVAGMAAVYAMREAPQRCRAVLAKLAAADGLIGFRAQIALQRWDAGEWPR